MEGGCSLQAGFFSNQISTQKGSCLVCEDLCRDCYVIFVSVVDCCLADKGRGGGLESWGVAYSKREMAKNLPNRCTCHVTMYFLFDWSMHQHQIPLAQFLLDRLLALSAKTAEATDLCLRLRGFQFGTKVLFLKCFFWSACHRSSHEQLCWLQLEILKSWGAQTPVAILRRNAAGRCSCRQHSYDASLHSMGSVETLFCPS